MINLFFNKQFFYQPDILSFFNKQFFYQLDILSFFNKQFFYQLDIFSFFNKQFFYQLDISSFLNKQFFTNLIFTKINPPPPLGSSVIIWLTLPLPSVIICDHLPYCLLPVVIAGYLNSP